MELGHRCPRARHQQAAADSEEGSTPPAARKGTQVDNDARAGIVVGLCPGVFGNECGDGAHGGDEEQGWPVTRVVQSGGVHDGADPLIRNGEGGVTITNGPIPYNRFAGPSVR